MAVSSVKTRETCARLFFPVLVSAFLAQAQNASDAASLQPRDEFSLKLPKISVSIDFITKDFNGVKLTFPGSEDQVFIGTYNDMYIKNTSQGAEKTLYSESPEKANFLSKFEIKYIAKTNKAIIETLEYFDKLLQKKNWPRCRYLDSYLPNFLNGYYYLIGAARNSTVPMSRNARVPEDEYDVSLSSPKTDWRVNQWQFNPEYLIKLRIASKELSHQIEAWQKALDNKSKEDEDITTPKEMEEALIIFIRVYFNLKPPQPVVVKKYRE